MKLGRVFGCLALVAGVFGTVAAKRPNILLIAIDDLGFADHEINGESDIKTPNMKKLAQSGIRLDNMYVQQVCSPTRSSLMTGKFPFRLGMQHSTTLTPGTTAHLPLDVPTLPELLKPRGYTTHMIGKWHLGYAKKKFTPHGRGFDTFRGYLQGQETYYNKTIGLKGMNGYDFWSNFDVDRSADGIYSLDLYMDEFKRIVSAHANQKKKQNKKKNNNRVNRNFESLASQENSDEVNDDEKESPPPFFVYFSHQTVHIPLEYRNEEERCNQIPNKWRKMYCNMIVELDDALGETEQILKKSGVWNDTLILLTTDNGGMTMWQSNNGNPSWPASVGVNFPLRSGKSSLFEGGVKSTAFITGGSNLIPCHARNTTYPGLMHAADFTAIALSAAGSSGNSQENKEEFNEKGMDGLNLFPAIIHHHRQQQQLQENNTKAASALQLPKRTEIPLNINYGGKKYTAIRFEKWKLIIGTATIVDNDGWFTSDIDKPREAAPKRRGHYMLFDIEADPEERTDLSEANPEMVAFGVSLIKKYMDGGYRKPQPNLPHVKSFPMLHHGVWSPFLRDDETISERNDLGENQHFVLSVEESLALD